MSRTPGEDVPWVLKRFVGFLSKFGLEVGTDAAVLVDSLHGVSSDQEEHSSIVPSVVRTSS